MAKRETDEAGADFVENTVNTFSLLMLPKCPVMKVKEESEEVDLKLSIQKTKIIASGPITSWEIDGEQCQTLFFWAPISLQMVTAAMKLRDAYSLEGKL